MQPTVVVAEKISESGLAALAESCQVDLAVGVDRVELLGRLAGAAGLIVRSATDVDAELITAAPELRVIGRAGIGVDNIDVAAATEAGIIVVNAPQANIISAAEHALALLLAQARNVARADATLRSGVWDRTAFQGVELHGKVLGVVGLGRIGTLVAQRALAFGMHLLAYDPYVSVDRARRLGVELVDLDTLLAAADFITIHLPLTSDTSGLIGKEALARVKPGVRIVNAARGGILDEDALAEAIRDGRVAGAGLDVFSSEPLTESPLFDLPGVVMTPHLGASTAEAQDKAGTDVAAAVAAALRGELVMSAVNIDMGSSVPEDVAELLPVAEDLGQVFTALAGGLPDRLIVRAAGKVGAGEARPVTLAVLRGAISVVSSRAVTYVNAPALAEQHGMTVDQETSDVAEDYQSVIGVRGVVGGREVSVSATRSRKGPVLVEIMGHDVELPVSPRMLIVRNSDVPGVIGRLGSFLGDLGVNIANMVVGREPGTGNAAMMGLNLDDPLSESQLNDLRRLDGITEARYVSLV
ncbi:MAG TPA: phosphoglycerate dehydrogenase [Acidimicrobiia bacterium]|nr:phosphoglycerate dehydrogenase [Acidimicrobiia bacterium]